MIRTILLCALLSGILGILHVPGVTAAPLTISLQASRQVLSHAPVRSAVEDTLQLLSRLFPQTPVSLNRDAAVILQLPGTVAPAAAASVLDQSYCWRSRRLNGDITLTLDAATPEAVSAGLYGLLQEQLGIRFIHPRQTLYPVHRRWPLAHNLVFYGQPRFVNRGFHLHTLHPVELTEQLHDPFRPGAFEEVAAYLDWLARNGQNSFQFFLLREVDRDAWPSHARRMVEYAHRRGIRCGVAISLAMIQQQAFQAITLLRPIPSHTRQIDQTLTWLFQAPWDFITLESMMGEHLPLLHRLLPAAQRHLEQQVLHRYRRPLFSTTHVIAGDEAERVRRPLLPESGILVHTVMCWSVSEPKAPVYGNTNQRFMLDVARQEVARRPTWYWPESSYWVGFDTPVPLLLLPYLDSRLDDIRVMHQIGVQGHLTFTSGWEWGYWLVDWSIARWSWRYRLGERELTPGPLGPLADLLPDQHLNRFWQEALSLQNRYLKERELIRQLAAATPFAELPPPFELPFQPEPLVSERRLLKNADQRELGAVLAGPIADLDRYAAAMERVTAGLTGRLSRLQSDGRISALQLALAEELITGLQVTALRARHRSLTLRALMAKNRPGLGGRTAFEDLLQQAVQLRHQAQKLVLRQEARYRYPVDLLARRRSSITAYPFGYLYPASRLFFWEREEQQAVHGRFDPFFMNLWDIRRTLGAGSLFVR